MRRPLPLVLVLLCAGGALPAEAAPDPVPTLTLERALTELRAQSPTARRMRARADEAAAVARQAAAPLLPHLSAFGTYTRNSDDVRIDPSAMLPAGLPKPSDAPGVIVIQPLEAVSATGVLEVPLFRPAAWAGWAAAKHAADAVKSGADQAEQDLELALMRAGWVASATDDVVAAAERALGTARAHAERAARALAAGTGSRLDVLRARTDVRRREGEAVRARSERDRALLALGTLLGRDGPVRVRMPEPSALGALSIPRLLEQAMVRRPDVAAAQAHVEAARGKLGAAWWTLAPQLVATGAAFASNVPYPTGAETGWRATVGLSWNLYDGGARAAQRREAEAALAAAQAAAETARLAVVREVGDAARDVQVAAEQLQLERSRRELASESAAAADRALRAGTVTGLDVLDAEDRLYEAETALAEARARLGVARAALVRATGGTFEG